ncbi:MAG: hydrogenase [Deltaproteobacteria bacterium]|nr:hydrogenase [Deltaproteobacteria bacterium]
MLIAVVLAPLAFAALAFLAPWSRVRSWLVPAGAVAHSALTLAALTLRSGPQLGGWLVLDPLGRLILSFLSTLFLISSFYVPRYLEERGSRPNRVFTGALLVFLAAMSAMVMSHHLGLMWVTIEAATLSAAPLLYFDRNARSLEAIWKYLMVGSVGIAIALLGSFFLAYSALQSGLGSSLLFEDLVREAPRLSKPWLRSGFVLLLVGYGTKMGLAPMHSWKPDAYGEAPGIAGALLAGGLTNCAFVAVLRFVQICQAAGEIELTRKLLVAMGLLSMSVAAAFVIRQQDYKRMLAYSSVEHMGILSFGVGLGGLGASAAVYHMINNGLGKGVLFLAAGNLHRAYGSKLTNDVAGAVRRLPGTGPLLLAGFFAITGAPPFGPFMSELMIVKAAFSTGHFVGGAIFLSALGLVFAGMGATVLSMALGKPPRKDTRSQYRESLATVGPPLVFLVLVFMMGVYVPPPVARLMAEASAFLEVAK